MSDIAKCSDSKCPSRTLCYRFTVEAEQYWQCYADFGRKKGRMRCEEFVDNSESCRCDLFEKSHKRTSSCDVFEVITQPALRKRDKAAKELAKRDKAGIKSQKHILKAWDKKMSEKNTNVSDGKRRKK